MAASIQEAKTLRELEARVAELEKIIELALKPKRQVRKDHKERLNVSNH